MSELTTQPAQTVNQVFAEFLKGRTHEPEAWQTIRHRAFARFNDLGWPTTSHEEWRFTNPKVLAKTAFALRKAPTEDLDTKWVESFFLGNDSTRLVIVDGHLHAGLSNLGQLVNTVEITTLPELLKEDPGVLAPYFQEHRHQAAQFGNLNTALMTAGAVFRIQANQKVEAPIQVLHIATKTEHPTMSHPRLIIFAGANSESSLVETFVSQEGGKHWTNNATQVYLDQGANFSHYLAQFNDESTYQVSNFNAYQKRDSQLRCTHLLTGSALMRNNLTVHLQGEGADCTINGLTLGHGSQVLDTHVEMNHTVPHCTSTQYFKTILDDKAHGVFGGRVIVYQDAQKTDAKQSNHNLLLSDDARIDTKPQLEIYADDVKCAHGATTGQLNEDALFYLATRGLDPKSAREVLLYAFAHEILDRLDIATLLEQAEKILLSRFTKGHLFGE